MWLIIQIKHSNLYLQQCFLLCMKNIRFLPLNMCFLHFKQIKYFIYRIWFYNFSSTIAKTVCFIQVCILVTFTQSLEMQFMLPIGINFIISRRALAREGDYEMMSVCACVSGCVRVCVSYSRRFLQNCYSYRFFVN